VNGDIDVRGPRWGGTLPPPTPELDKMRAVHDHSQEIGAFLDWLSGRGLSICQMVESQTSYRDDANWVPDGLGIEQRLASYFNIDLDECERERTRLLEHVRALNETRGEKT
jgi:hypothetical protein